MQGPGVLRLESAVTNKYNNATLEIMPTPCVLVLARESTSLVSGGCWANFS